MKDEKVMLTVDGSQGEGGGQIVRSALALSLITGQSFTINNIRAGRPKPGLMRQHLTAVQAAAQIGNAQLEGDSIGSQSFTFQPSAVQSGDYTFTVGTAGSATLVLQTVLPALLNADGRSTLTLEGGTHKPWAPPYDFWAKTYLPLVNRMGPVVTSALEKYGFHPAGGGRFTVEIDPSSALNGFELLERGEMVDQRARALVSNLSPGIAKKELAWLQKRTAWADDKYSIEVIKESSGPGNIVFIELESEQVTEVFTGFGRPSLSSEKVARSVLKEVREYWKTTAPVGPHLADQLLLLLGISAWQNSADRAGGRFVTTRLTPHSETQLLTMKQFLDVDVDVQQTDDDTCLVSVGC